MLSVCGIDCGMCPSLFKECHGGCQAVAGKVYWTKQVGVTVCQLYQCVTDKKISDCGACEKLPCEMWFSLKDPSLTDEEHRVSIKDRVVRLKSARK